MSASGIANLSSAVVGGVWRVVMKIPAEMPRLEGFRFPREVVTHAVWAYHRFALSTADVEGLLAERGATVSREAVRKWVNRFGKDLCILMWDSHGLLDLVTFGRFLGRF